MDTERDLRGTRWASVTPSDDADVFCYGVQSNDGGNIALMGDDGNSEIFLFAAGEVKPLAAKRIMATNTDSTDIIAIF